MSCLILIIAPLLTPACLSPDTVGGITASFAATGQGYLDPTRKHPGPHCPWASAGQFIYPSSVNAADLLVSFSKPLIAFSILYAPQELACDDSATMRVTAYMNSTPVGTSTTNATCALCLHLAGANT